METRLYAYILEIWIWIFFLSDIIHLLILLIISDF